MGTRNYPRGINTEIGRGHKVSTVVNHGKLLVIQIHKGERDMATSYRGEAVKKEVRQVKGVDPSQRGGLELG